MVGVKPQPSIVVLPINCAATPKALLGISAHLIIKHLAMNGHVAVFIR
jgi:hypothetical protein